MQIQEIYRKDIRTVSKNQTIQEALKIMGSKLTKLPVTDGGKLVGIITTRDILRVVGSSHSQSPEHAHISGVMQKELKVLPPDTDIKTAVRTMLDSDISSLLVVEGETLLGLLTKTDLLGACKEITRPVSEFAVEPLTVSPGHRLPHVRELMFKKNISIIPVTDGGKFIGIILSRDIARKILDFKKDVKKHQDAIRNMAVEDFYKPDTTSIPPETTVGEAATKLLEEKRTSLPIMENGELVGIVSKTDLLRALLD